MRDDSGHLGTTDPSVFGAAVPITGAIADQHSALFAQGCVRPGMVKCTHGTGTFLDMTIGTEPVIETASGLTCQIAWRMDGQTVYALDGYAGSSGAAVQWLRDGAAIIDTSADSEAVALTVPDNGGVYFVPALTGLSAPYWDSYARGLIIGISPGTKRGHLARATLEGIVYERRSAGTRLLEMVNDEAVLIEPLDPLGRQDVVKVMLSGAPSTLDAVQPQIDDAAPIMRRSMGRFYETSTPGATKKDALRLVLSKLSIEPGECLGIADGDTDAEWLADSGLPVAVSNAMPAARDAAVKHIDHHAEEAVADFLQSYFRIGVL